MKLPILLRILLLDIWVAIEIFHFTFQVKKGAAETEPAWQGCGKEVGLKIWRIVKFKVGLIQ